MQHANQFNPISTAGDCHKYYVATESIIKPLDMIGTLHRLEDSVETQNTFHSTWCNIIVSEMLDLHESTQFVVTLLCAKLAF